MIYCITRSHRSQTSPYQFRNAFYSEFVIFGIFAIVVVFLPESPSESLTTAHVQ